MAALTLKSLLSPKAEAFLAVAALVAAMGDTLGIEDTSGQPLVGALAAGLPTSRLRWKTKPWAG